MDRGTREPQDDVGEAGEPLSASSRSEGNIPDVAFA